MIRRRGGTMVHWERLSTGIDAGAAGVGLAGRGVAGCFAGLVGAGDGFNGGADGLSRSCRCCGEQQLVCLLRAAQSQGSVGPVL